MYYSLYTSLIYLFKLFASNILKSACYMHLVRNEYILGRLYSFNPFLKKMFDCEVPTPRIDASLHLKKFSPFERRAHSELIHTML